MKIKFSPPFINDLILKEVEGVLTSGWITTGPKTRELEQMMCYKYQIPACLGVNSWTSGVVMFLKWWGIKEGDEVIIPAYTYAATALAVLHAGAKPVIVDVTDDFTIDVDAVRSAITARTKVIMPVDIGGLTADYDAIKELVTRPEVQSVFTPGSVYQNQLGRILVMGDAAHSLGARYGTSFSGTLCDITVFSLHAVKNVTSGEGGLVAINLPKPFDNDEVWGLLKRFSLNGQTKDAFTKSQAGEWRYDIVELGMKCNMPDLNAAVALGQLKQYDFLLGKRKSIFKIYSEYFAQYDWAIPPIGIDTKRESSYHVYNLRLRVTESQRDDIIRHAAERGVATNVHFIPLPDLTLFREMNLVSGGYEKAKALYEQEISLPIYPQLSYEEVEYVCQVVRDGYMAVLPDLSRAI